MPIRTEATRSDARAPTETVAADDPSGSSLIAMGFGVVQGTRSAEEEQEAMLEMVTLSRVMAWRAWRRPSTLVPAATLIEAYALNEPR